MQGKTLIRRITVPLLAILLLFITGYIAFVPSNQEPGYKFITAWGGKGVGPGRFNDPTGIAVSADEVFVSDARNGRIQVFDFNGNFLRTFGRPGEAPGKLGRPMNLAIQHNELYVPEYFNDRIQVFSLDGEPLRSIGRAGDRPGQFNAPGGLAVATNGDLLVADFYSQRLQHLKADGTFIKQWGTTSEKGIRAGEFNYPTDVALLNNETLYVTDGYNDRVQVFSIAGNFLHKWGGPFALNIKGPFNGWFATVSSIAIGPEGNVFVTDFYNHRIQKFDARGRFLTAFGEQGNAPGQFDRPLGVAVAADGTVFVADLGNHRIQKWRPGE